MYSIFSSKEPSLEGISNPIFGHSYDESRYSKGEAKTVKKGGILGRREWSYRKKLLILTVVLVSIVGIAAAGRFLLWSEGVCDSSSDQCQNGGTCQEYGGGYKCICADGWGGKNCNTAAVCYSSPMHKLEKWGKNSGGFDDTSSSVYSRFGSSVANVGYVDGDGHMDTAVGAEYDGKDQYGSVFIIFSQNNRIEQQLKITTKNVNGGLNKNAHFGAAIARVGDIFTKSRTNTIAVGAPGVDKSQGAVYFVQLGQDYLGEVVVSGEELHIKRLKDDYLRAGDEFGHSIASLGGDLFKEDGSMANVLAVGAPGSNGGRGAVYLLSVDDMEKWVVTKIGHMEGGLATELDAGDTFGSSIALLGDVNGDGVMDIAVGAPKDDDGGTNTGAVYILFLSPSKDLPVKSEQKISSLRGGLLFSGLTDNDQFGQSIAVLGDLDGDGVVDLAVGTPGDDGIGGGEWNHGAIHAILLTQDGKVKGNEKLKFTAQGGDGALLQPGDAFGYSVACMSRADTAGRSGGNASLVVGAYFDSEGGHGYGAVYVVDVSPRSVPPCELGTRCKENYSRTDTCQAVDECKVLASPCRSSLGADGCVDTKEDYYCICEDNGWEGDACEQDVDECRLQVDDCNGQVCNNTPGDFTCADCPTGYELDAGGENCLQINECTRDKENTLCGSNGGSCKDTDGGYECICPEFWEGDCSDDVDECQKNTDDCTDSTQRCENEHGKKWTCWDCGEHKVSSADGLRCVVRSCVNEVKNEYVLERTTTHDWIPESSTKFGYSVAALDLDRVEPMDMVVGAPRENMVYLVIRRPDTVELKKKVTLEGVVGGDDNFGGSVASMGDLDGNSFDDIAVGAFHDKDGAVFTGAVYLLLLNGDGGVVNHSKLSASATGFHNALIKAGKFGASVTRLGDFSLAVGAPNVAGGEGDKSTIFFIYLEPGGLKTKSFYRRVQKDAGYGEGLVNLGFVDGVKTLVATNSRKNELLFIRVTELLFVTATHNVAGSSAALRIGDGITSMGDINGDGIPDLALGKGDEDYAKGRVVIVLLNFNENTKLFSLGAHKLIGDGKGGWDHPLYWHDYFGSGIAFIGDHNNDRILDLAVGSFGHDEWDNQGTVHGKTFQGAVYIVSVPFGFVTGDGC